MLNLDCFFAHLDKYAPLSLSHRLIEKGEYDNSGIIIKDHDIVSKILFSLDLSESAIKRAKSLSCDTIVTHHPAIYTPLKTVHNDNAMSKTVLLAIKNNINVISMHLNLDIANGGIDDCLSKGLGAEKYKILDSLDENNGYGREFCIEKTTLNEFFKKLKKEFRSKKALCYGSRNSVVNKCASFCGAGSSYAEKLLLSGKLKADTVITSDMSHHIIRETVESGKNLILLTHYSAENYGFKCYFNKIKEEIKGKAECFFFEDKRFL